MTIRPCSVEQGEPGWARHCGDLWRAAVLSVAGRDICAIVGPSPRSAGDWAAMMRRLGVRSMGGVVSAVHGTAIAPRLARRGDIVRKGWALGVCRGETAEFFGGVMLGMGEVDQAWSASGWARSNG